MRLLNLVPALLVAAAAGVSAQADDTPELNVITTFPNNPFSQVKNGQRNQVVFSISSPPGQDRVLTLEGITGAFLNKKKAEGQKGYVVRNMTTTTVKSLRISKQALEIPYEFWPEFKPQDMGVEFRLLLTDGQSGKKHNIPAYQGSVTVVEPPTNWLDWQLLSTYAFLASVVGIVIYWASQSYPGKSKTINKRKAAAASSSSSLSTPSKAASASSSVGAPNSAGGVQDEWLPDHLRKDAGRTSPKPKKRR